MTKVDVKLNMIFALFAKYNPLLVQLKPAENYTIYRT